MNAHKYADTPTIALAEVQVGDVILVPLTGKRLVESVKRTRGNVTLAIRYASGDTRGEFAPYTAPASTVVRVVKRGQRIETPAERKARREASKATRASKPRKATRKPSTRKVAAAKRTTRTVKVQAQQSAPASDLDNQIAALTALLEKAVALREAA